MLAPGSLPLPRDAWSVAAASARLKLGHALPVQVAGLPVLLHRREDGLGAWLNICPHRSAPVVQQEGRCDRFRCPYHGWTFDTAGDLVRSPHFEGDPGQQRLTPVAVHEQDGLIWVNPTLTETPPPFLDALRQAGAPEDPGWVVHRFVSHELEADWSVYVENYLEAYHIPFVHPGLARDVELASYRVHVHDGFVTHEATRRDGAPAAGFWAWIWPLTMLNVYEDGGMNLERVLPRGPGRCTIEYTYLFPAAVDAERLATALAQSDEVTAEDIAIVEAVQRNLDLGLVPQGPLSPRHESAIAAFRSWAARGGPA